MTNILSIVLRHKTHKFFNVMTLGDPQGIYEMFSEVFEILFGRFGDLLACLVKNVQNVVYVLLKSA